VVDSSEPEWLRHIPHYNLPSLDYDESVHIDPGTGIEYPVDRSMPLSGASGAVYRSGDTALKLIDPSEMKEYAVERHVIGERLGQKLPNAGVPVEGISFSSDTIMVRCFRSNVSNGSDYTPSTYCLPLPRIQVKLKRMGSCLAALLQEPGRDPFGPTPEQRSKTLKVIAVSGLTSLLRLYLKKILMKFVFPGRLQ
jgi:hypothetical protein